MIRAGQAMTLETGRVLSVSELAARIADALEARVGRVWVGGELSGVKRSGPGHLWFCLKDEAAQIDAVMFRGQNRTLAFEPQDGMDVLVLGRVGLWSERGRLQLYVDHMEPRGLGALRLAFEQLKARLQAEGLFEASRKRALPPYPRVIGIVTALHGAAIHDMRVTLRRRWPAARVIVRPVRVQGEGAAAEIAEGIADLCRLSAVDVLIVGRGGGSLEDLWAFNEEVVARAIAAARVPVVSAVGHEIDFTIADFVADVRAATPTAAAQLVVPDRAAVGLQIEAAATALRLALARRLRDTRHTLAVLARRLGDPRRRVTTSRLRLEDLAERLRAALARRCSWERREVSALARRLAQAGPRGRVESARPRIAALAERLVFGMAVRVRTGRERLDALAGRLGALSPLACLARGYAIVRQGGPDGPIVRDAATLGRGARISVLFGRGRASGRIEDVEP